MIKVIMTFLIKHCSSNIGDLYRSPASSSTFFKSIDQNGDGVLISSEIVNFLENEIEDTTINTNYERDSEARRVMSELDQNKDEIVEPSDVYEYWKHLENLLTAEEVSDWVVHAVQLPEEIGRIFKENIVTGYDFPELVENNGEALYTDLGIEKQSFRKRIIQLMNARMLGIGASPEPPEKIKYEIENCNAINFHWKKPASAGFPIHSYRVQRRAVMLQNSPQNQSDQETINSSQFSSECSASSELNGVAPFNYDYIERFSSCHLKPKSPHLSWETIYEGAEAEFLDYSLEAGYNFVYRFQAWNSVGRSSWVTVDVFEKLKRNKCLDPNSNQNKITNFSQRSWFQDIHFIFNLIVSIGRFFFATIACFAAAVRWKRAATISTMSEIKAPFPKFVKMINKWSHAVLGLDIIPKYLVESERTKNTRYDEIVNATNLNGYKKELVYQESDTPFDRRVRFMQKASSLTNIYESKANENINSVESSPCKADIPDKPMNFRARFMNRSVSQGALDCSKTANEQSLKPIEVATGKSAESRSSKKGMLRSGANSFSPLMTRRKSPLSSVQPQHYKIITLDGLRKENLENINCIHENIPSDYCAVIPEELSSVASSYCVDECDDHTICNTCRKKYKFGKRWKHHCARCLSTFCHKHGRTTHSNLTSCKIPGSCICNKCLEIEGITFRR